MFWTQPVGTYAPLDQTALHMQRFDDAGHWIQLEQPEKLNRLLLEFFGAAEAEVPTDARARLAHHDPGGLAARLKERRDSELADGPRPHIT